MVRENQVISDMDDVIIETIPSYELEDQAEVPNAVNEEEIIFSRSMTSNRRAIKSERVHDVTTPTTVEVKISPKKEDYSKFMIKGKNDGNKDKYKCLFCTKVFNYVSRLKLHLRVHTGEKPFACSMCNFTASYKTSVEVHMRSHTGEKPFACSICEFRAARKANVDDHMRVHTGEKPFACPLCDFRSAQQSAVTCHIRRHTGEKKFVCNICNFRTAYKHILQAHHRVHTGERPFQCEMCQYRGSTKLNVRLHMRRHTGEKPYACSLCDFRSTKRYSVKLHMRRHTGEKPFKCSKCNYSAAQKFCLLKHMTKHIDNTWYNCSTCDFKTPSTKKLSAHLKKHVITRESPCPECGISFINSILLMDHLVSVHSYFDQQTIQEICNGISEYEELSVYAADVKVEPKLENFSCSVCNYTTGLESNLEIHARLHDLLYACKFCELKFSSPEDMNTHLVTIHRSKKKRIYVCPFCTNLFQYKSLVYAHLKEEHTLSKGDGTIQISGDDINANPESEDLFSDFNEDIIFKEDMPDNEENSISLVKIEDATDELDISDATENSVRNVVFRSKEGKIMTTKRVVICRFNDSN